MRRTDIEKKERYRKYQNEYRRKNKERVNSWYLSFYKRELDRQNKTYKKESDINI
jgi:hypothetical protein